LNIPEGVLIDIDQIDNYPDERLVIITTGSQGEPMSALARIAASEHKKVEITPGDLVVISASPIPGNEKTVSKVINELFKKGAEVIYEALADVHVSGHACQEELKLIHSLVHSKFFMPVHGEYRHLKHHSDLAKKLGMDAKNIFILETGDVLELSEDDARITEKVPTGTVFVDGIGVGDVGNIVLRDRRNLAQDGMLTIVVGIDRESFSIIAGPDIITRGFVYVKESEDLINEVKGIATEELEYCLGKRILEWNVLKSNMKKAIENHLYEKTKRRPSVFPIIMEI